MDDWLRRAANQHPGRPALERQDGEALSYASLLQRATARADELRADGVGAGDRLALPEHDRFEFAADLHAAVRLRAVAVPIDLRLSADEQRRRTADGPVPVDDVATVMHTSGTTSAPKPVHLTRGNWQANAVGSALALGLDPQERWLCVMPLAHVGGLSILLRSAFYGTTVVVHQRFESNDVLEALMDPGRRITMISVVPTMLDRLLDAGLARPPALRWALLGGGPIPPGLLIRAEAASIPVAPSYGMTEACSQIATFGFPLHGVELRVQQQEILVRGGIVAPGAVDADGWLHTGDLGELDGSGKLHVIGRKSDTIISGGENISPTEVEAVLSQHPAVADVGVFAAADAEWGEVVCAAVVLREGTELEPDSLRAFCAQHLARFKVPKRIAFVTELPRTPSGKLLRRELTGDVR